MPASSPPPDPQARKDPLRAAGPRTVPRGAGEDNAYSPQPAPPRAADAVGDRLRLLNDILGLLNRTPDVREALSDVLARLVEAMGLARGWIVLRDPLSEHAAAGPGFVLAAHYGLPEELGLERHSVWDFTCSCEDLCLAGSPMSTRNEPRCPRLLALRHPRGTAPVHASAPLRANSQVLGMLNVASEDWSPVGDDTLAFLDGAATVLGGAIVRSRVYERVLSQRLEEQRIMLDMFRRMLGHGALEGLMTPLLEGTRELLGADACCLLLCDREAEVLRFRAAVGWRKDPVAERWAIPVDPSGDGPPALWGGETTLIADIQSQPLEPAMASWMRAEGFRGHMAAPLVIDGHCRGSLIAHTRTPGRFGDQESRVLLLMANTAALAVETAHLQQEARDRQQIECEMRMAHDIQAAMLPSGHVELAGWEVASCYQAAQEVGGDFFDVIRLPGPTRRVALVIGDVAGKSVSGALLMAMCLGAIREAARQHDDPVAVLQEVNRRVLRRSRDDRFVTAFFGILDKDSGHLRYASAGHNAPLCYRAATRQVEELPIQGLALGILPAIGAPLFEADIAPGDTLVLYTDGVNEAQNEQGECFGEQRLFEAIRSGGGGAHALRERILQAVADFSAGSPPSDDITLLLVHRKQAATDAP
jgi:serine phosphatase RsbU (regulator of sigma subunit)